MCAVGVFYIGIIGANLHPLQSASELARGPLTNPMAKKELKSISPQQANLLVGHACTRVGILIGVGMGIIVFNLYHWSWLLSGISGIVSSVITGSILKLTFKTMP